MAGEMLGSVPGDLRLLASQLSQHADSLDQLGQSISGQLRHTSWCGGDADHARYQWDVAQLRAIVGVAETLRLVGQDLHRQARQQEWASDAGGGYLDRYCAPLVPNSPDWLAFWGSKGMSDLAMDFVLDVGSTGAALLDWISLNSVVPHLARWAVADVLKSSLLAVPGLVFDVVEISRDLADGNAGAVAFGVVGLGLGVGAAIVLSPFVAVSGGVAAGVVGLSVGWNLLGNIPGVKDAVGGFILEGVTTAIKNPVPLLLANPLTAPLAATYLIADAAVDLAPAVGRAVGDVGEVVGDAASALAEDTKDALSGPAGFLKSRWPF